MFTTFRIRFRLLLPFLALMLATAVLVACGGDDDDDNDDGDNGDNGGASSEMAAFADAAEAEFEDRGEGTFFNTEVIAYCRQGGGFDDGPFGAMGFAPEDDAEYCYNVSADRTSVALGRTEGLDEPTECLILDASSGSVVRGEVTEVESGCLP